MRGRQRLTGEDRRALTALFWSNVNPYGTFRLDIDARLDLAPTAIMPPPPDPGRQLRPSEHGDAMTQTRAFQDLTDPQTNVAVRRPGPPRRRCPPDPGPWGRSQGKNRYTYSASPSDSNVKACLASA